MSRARMILTVGTGLLLLLPPPVAAQQGTQQQSRQRVGPPALADTTTAVALSAAFRAASERALPAVVFIAVEQAPLVRDEQLNRLPPGLDRLFRMPEMDPRPRQGSGSGFIIDAEGHILTNTHVVADASRVRVQLVDGREYAAEVVGTDVSSDIAVIRIQPRPGETLPVAPLGDSDPLRVGDWVLALGSPLGLQFSVTAGIVSAKGRNIRGQADQLQAFIQTDAAINPGNSGGPLIDLFGRVVGVNSAIFGSDRFIGYGFAVPITLAMRVVDDLMEYGYLRRPRLGVRVSPITAVDAEVYGLAEVRGALAAAVEPGGPGDEAGLRASDVILSVNGVRVQDDIDLITRLADLRPGETVTLGIRRDRRDMEVRARLGEFERPESRARPAPVDTLAAAEQTLGFSVLDLTPEIGQRIGYRGVDGVVVSRVVPYSPAASRQIGTGMIILAINGQRVNSREQVQRIASTLEAGSAISLLIYDTELGTESVVNYRARE
jgi:serine protease Do